MAGQPAHGLPSMSLSARRAWIEIGADLSATLDTIAVALRKESVDRNLGLAAGLVQFFSVALRKESVDRNHRVPGPCVRIAVALRKESVDRNQAVVFRLQAVSGRSPQGERG